MGTSDRGVIFPSGDAYYSEPFDLIKDLGMVSIIGLQDGDVAHVEIFIGDSCHGEWVPFSISCCGQMGINAPVNQMFLVVPNKYRLVFSNEAGEHLTDPSWFENVKAFYKIVESDLDLSNLAKGDCDMVCRETAAPSSAQADFDGIKIGSHVSGNGMVTEFDIPVIKRNGQSLPITVDPDTGKACINIIDENTDTDNFITNLTISGDTITAVRSDGVTFPVTITNPPETDGIHLDGTIAPVINLQAQTITYATLNDLDETAAAPLVQDISALIAALTSAPPPSVVGGSNVTVTTNANGDWVISVPNPTVDTDTDTYSTFELQPDGSTLVTEVDINGNPTGNTYTIAGSQQVVLYQDGAAQTVGVPLNSVQPRQRFQDANFAVSLAPVDMIHRECDFVNLPRLVEDILNPASTIVNGARTYDLTAFGVPADACGVEVYIYTAVSALNNTTTKSTSTFVQENGYLVQSTAAAGAGLNGGLSQLSMHIRGTTLRLLNVNVLGQDDPEWTPTNRLLVRIGGYYLPIHV